MILETDSSASNSEENKVSMLLIMDTNGCVVKTIDLFKDYGMYKLTSIIEVRDQLVISGNHKADNQAALAWIQPEDNAVTVTDYTKDMGSISQVTYLAKASSTLAHIYGHVEYDDDVSHSDQTQRYQSFLQLLDVSIAQ